jgi:hypothetical protein
MYHWVCRYLAIANNTLAPPPKHLYLLDAPMRFVEEFPWAYLPDLTRAPDSKKPRMKLPPKLFEGIDAATVLATLPNSIRAYHLAVEDTFCPEMTDLDHPKGLCERHGAVQFSLRTTGHVGICSDDFCVRDILFHSSSL